MCLEMLKAATDHRVKHKFAERPDFHEARNNIDVEYIYDDSLR